MNIEKHFDLLGHKAEDVVTGFKGVITSLSFDLYGCVQVVITPATNEKDKVEDGRWFDVTRLKVTSKKPVIALPDFDKGYAATGKKGCAEKTLP